MNTDEKFEISFQFEFTDVSPNEKISIQNALNEWAEQQREEFMAWNDGSFKNVEWKPDFQLKPKKKKSRKKTE
jgi:hypothetical protein